MENTIDCKNCKFYTESDGGLTHCNHKLNANDVEGNTRQEDCPFNILVKSDFKEVEQYNNALATAEQIATWTIGKEGIQNMINKSPKNDIYLHAMGIILFKEQNQ